jgi:hypothetical protein
LLPEASRREAVRTLIALLERVAGRVSGVDEKVGGDGDAAA